MNEKNPTITKITVSRREPSPGERARLRACQLAQEQGARTRRAALELLETDRQARDDKAFAPTVQGDLQATRRRPLDAPMATYADRLGWEPKGDLPEPGELPTWGVGRLILTSLLMVASFIAGVATGRLL